MDKKIKAQVDDILKNTTITIEEREKQALSVIDNAKDISAEERSKLKNDWLYLVYISPYLTQGVSPFSTISSLVIPLPFAKLSTTLLNLNVSHSAGISPIHSIPLSFISLILFPPILFLKSS